jgi:hypothetical protein
MNEVARSLESNPRLRNLSQQRREKIVEFVTGNTLFVMLHELLHAAVAELQLPVLGREEDAADDFATLRLLNVGSDLSHRVLAEAARGWFLSDRRDRRDGEKLVFYGEHGLDRQRAYQIVCLMVGSDPMKFGDLAEEMKLPDDRQESCNRDYQKILASWNTVLAPHRRDAEQQKTKISWAYGDAKGDLAVYAEGLRRLQLLETIAAVAENTLSWPAPFALEAKTCGFINARWIHELRKLELCYELVADFAELYREFNSVTTVKKRKTK